MLLNQMLGIVLFLSIILVPLKVDATQLQAFNIKQLEAEAQYIVIGFIEDVKKKDSVVDVVVVKVISMRQGDNPVKRISLELAARGLFGLDVRLKKIIMVYFF